MDYFLIATSLLKIVSILFLVILPMVSYSVYAERRVSAFLQDRLGPNRVGPAGLFQPIADMFKLLLKEDFTPRNVNTFYYWLAPCLAVMPAIITIAVVPFGSTLLGVPMVIADVNVGILFVFAIASLGVYGIGLAVIPIFLLVGNLRLTSVVRYQIEHGWFIAPFIGDWMNPWKWLLAIPMVISFIVFTIAIFAETNRLPFDLPEAEQELAGGYNTEYSSMKFSLYFLGEYAAMITGSAVIVTLFFGGWHLPLPSWHGGFNWVFVDGNAPGWRGVIGGLFNIATFFTKVALLIFMFMWVRWTLPRFRYDQLMRLGWLFFFEIALVNIFIVAWIVAYLPS